MTHGLGRVGTAIALALALGLVLAGCSDDAAESSPSSVVDGDAPAPAETLVWAMGSNGANFFDPHKATNPFARSWMYPFYDRLTMIDEAGEVQPMLAESWEFSADGSSLVFHLRDGVTFHDGERFDAAAAKANLDRARDRDQAPGTFVDLLAVTSVAVVDDLTIELALGAPGGALPALLSDQAGMMISPPAFDNPDLATMPVGAGPFRATEFRVDEAMLAEAFDDYWEPTLPRVDEIELRFILDPATRLRATADGEVHGGALDVGQFSRQDALDEGLAVTDRFSTALYQLFLNTERIPEARDRRVRRAMAMAIDQAAISAALFNGECAPSDQVFGDGWFAHAPAVDADHLPYDPSAARALLAEADAEAIEFTAITANIPSFVAQAEAVAAQLGEIGVSMTVRPTPIPELIAGFLVNRTADAYWTVNPGAGDPAKIVSTSFLPQSPFNPGGFEIAGLADLHGAAQHGSTAERASVYAEIATLLADEQLSIAVCTPSSIMAHHPDVTGVALLPTLTDVDLRQVGFGA